MTYLRLLWIHLRLGVMNELQYRTNLIIQLVHDAKAKMDPEQVQVSHRLTPRRPSTDARRAPT